jgi:hypothetical protein
VPHPSQNIRASVKKADPVLLPHHIHNSRYENASKEFHGALQTARVSVHWFAVKNSGENKKATRQQGGLFFKGE